MSARVPLADYEAQRIALIKPSALGDILNTLPILTAVRQRYPQAHLAWIVNRSYAPLLEGHPDLDEVIAFDRGALKKNVWLGLKSTWRFLRELRARRFDLVLDLQGLFRSGVMTWATRAPRRVGLNSAREGSRWFYSEIIQVPNPWGIHAVERYWHVAQALGRGAEPKQFRLPIHPAAQAWAEEQLAACPKPWLVFAVGSRWETKRWPTDSFAELARRAHSLVGGTILFIGGKEEQSLAQQVSEQLVGPRLDLTGATSLPQLAAVVQQATVVVSNDSGPLHLATALGRPVLAPYTCTKVQLNGPFGSEEYAVEARVPCQGSYLQKCPKMICMDELTPDRLWPLLAGILQRWQSSSLSA